MSAFGPGSGDIKVGRRDSPTRSTGSRCGNRYEIGASVCAPHHEKVRWDEDSPGGLQGGGDTLRGRGGGQRRVWGVFQAEGWRATAAPFWFGVSAKSCESRAANTQGPAWGPAGKVSLARGRLVGILLRDLGLLGRGGVAPSAVLFPTPHPPAFLQACGPHSWHACQCSSAVGFVIPTCLFCSARSFPRASKLERSLAICLGQSPIPRHLLLPSSESIP